MRSHGGVDILRARLVRCFVLVRPARDEQKSSSPVQLMRPDDGEPVLPYRTIHFGGAAPGLRCHIEDVSCVAFAGNSLDEFVSIIRVGGLYVLVEASEF